MTDENAYAADLVRLLEVVNEGRRAGGAAELSELPPGDVGDANHCLVAKAFNFGCSVTHHDVLFYYERYGQPASDPAAIRAAALELGDYLGTEVYETREAHGILIELPRWAGDLISAFDRGELPQELYA